MKIVLSILFAIDMLVIIYVLCVWLIFYSVRRAYSSGIKDFQKNAQNVKMTGMNESIENGGCILFYARNIIVVILQIQIYNHFLGKRYRDFLEKSKPMHVITSGYFFPCQFNNLPRLPFYF